MESRLRARRSFNLSLRVLIVGLTVGFVVFAGAGAWVAGTFDPHEPEDEPSLAATRTAAEPSAVFTLNWARTDRPVLDGVVSRTWMWGPGPTGAIVLEDYADSPGGVRAVQYYDKSRMEITDPAGDPASIWYVTNGLLVVEMVHGQIQEGDDVFVDRDPPRINVAGDPDDPNGPTYATLAALLDAPPLAEDEPIVQRLSRDGQVTIDPALASYGVSATELVSQPGIKHRIAKPFWELMNTSGTVWVNGRTTDDRLFPNPFYATGYPITEAYWARVRVGGIERDVLLQCFERRCLTYTPGNPPGFEVEAGNVGLHYRQWRYSDAEGSPTATAGPTATAPSATATAEQTPAGPTATEAVRSRIVTIGPGAVDAWTRSIVRDSTDQVWVVAIDNNMAHAGTGPGQLRVYRATTSGIPTAFEAIPSATLVAGGNEPIAFADAAIDDADQLHVVWLDRGRSGQPVRYAVFDTTTASWTGDPLDLDASQLTSFGANQGQGGVSIALGPDHTIRVAYVVAGGNQQIRVRTYRDGAWDEPVEPLRVDNAFVWHPAQAVAPDGTWYLAAYDASNRRILATVNTDGDWSPAVTIADGVLGPENIDQGPAMLCLPSGEVALTYLDGRSFVRVSMFQEGDWTDRPIGGDYFTHSQGLGVSADGTLLIAGHDENSPPDALNIVRGTLDGWGIWGPLVAIHADGSEVFRWAGAFSSPSEVSVDLLFFDEDTNDDGLLDDQTLYYLSVPLD